MKTPEEGSLSKADVIELAKKAQIIRQRQEKAMSEMMELQREVVRFMRIQELQAELVDIGKELDGLLEDVVCCV